MKMTLRGWRKGILQQIWPLHPIPPELQALLDRIAEKEGRK